MGDSIDTPWPFGGPNDAIHYARIFKKELELIDQKYTEFFKDKGSLMPVEKHDSVFNHCKTHIGYNPVKFFFTDDVVPENIQKECFDAFKKIFGYEAYPRNR